MPLDISSSLDACRQAAQLEFIASNAPLVLGSLHDTPFGLNDLHSTPPRDAALRIDSGLSAIVWRLEAGGRRWTLKQARPAALVRNVDGQTAFLNEIQRRIDHAALKAQDPQRWVGLVDTTWGSFRDGLLLSPWIEGQAVQEWTERPLRQLLTLACELWLSGLFEWDLSDGNLLDDGTQLRLFDFGYQYRFDPRRQFSSAGHGREPLFHPAERFETRTFSACLLRLELQQGAGAALAAFRREKAVALEVYRGLRHAAAAQGAEADVLAWLDGIVHRWAQALRGDAAGLYLAENWRSHVLDLDDDLRGRSCTPLTLQRADWLLRTLDEHADALQAQQAFFWADRERDLAALRAHYQALRQDAQACQLNHLEGAQA